MPRIKSGGECCFVGMRKCERECPELFASFGLRPSRQILGHLLHLMELADLYRNVVENVEETSPPVHHDGLDFPVPLFENQTAIAIVGHAFSFNFVPPNILLEVDRAKNAHAIGTAPEGGVG